MSLHCPRSGSGPPEPGPTQVRTSQVRSRSSLQVDRTAFAGPGPGEQRTANPVRTARTDGPSQPNVFSTGKKVGSRSNLKVSLKSGGVTSDTNQGINCGLKEKEKEKLENETSQKLERDVLKNDFGHVWHVGH